MKRLFGTLKDPIIIENVTCASNSTLDQACLLKDNKKLKEQLEMERLKPTSKGKILYEILARQTMRYPRQGMGFDPKNDKNGAN